MTDKKTDRVAENDVLAGLPTTYTPPVSGQDRIKTIPGVVARRVNPHPTTRSEAASKGLVMAKPGSGFILNEADFPVHSEFGCFCDGDCLIYIERKEHYKARRYAEAQAALNMARSVLPPEGSKIDSKIGPQIEVDTEIIETMSSRARRK